MTTGAPSFTKATRLLVVPRSMPTILDIRHLSLDAGQQVVDVVAFEDALAQRLEHRTPLGVSRVAVDERVPLRRQLIELRLVRRALLVDRPPRLLEPSLQLIGRRARGAQVTDLVKLFVEREDRSEE